jgi:hypothetical protein
MKDRQPMRWIGFFCWLSVFYAAETTLDPVKHFFEVSIGVYDKEKQTLQDKKELVVGQGNYAQANDYKGQIERLTQAIENLKRFKEEWERVKQYHETLQVNTILLAKDAELEGLLLQGESLVGWSAENKKAVWKINSLKPGLYKVKLMGFWNDSVKKEGIHFQIQENVFSSELVVHGSEEEGWERDGGYLIIGVGSNKLELWANSKDTEGLQIKGVELHLVKEWWGQGLK